MKAWESYGLSSVKRMSLRARRNPSKFWGEMASCLTWFKRPRTVIEGEPPNASWYSGGTLNISFNAVDRNLDEPERVAFYWTNEAGEERAISYRELWNEVNRASYVLREMGIRKGDTVSLIMPSVPEAVFFSLAVHRLGAVLVIHYIGLSEDTLAYRLNDAGSKLLILATRTVRNGKEIDITSMARRALSKGTQVEKVLVVGRGKRDSHDLEKGEVDYNDVYSRGKVEVRPVPVESNSPSTIYYTSGTTGRPKGLEQSTGGYLVALNWAFRAMMNPRRGEVWWTISELGWPVWPMANLYVIPVMGLTAVLFEGFVGHRPDTFVRVVERFGVNLVWSSTTTLYTLKSLGDESVSGDTSSLRLILNTGEPLNVGAWYWLRQRLPHVYIGDAYWMTEHLFPIAGTPWGVGEIPYKPGSAGVMFPGSEYHILDDDGRPLGSGKKGYIVIRPISPALARMHNDPDNERFLKTYWSRFPGYFYTGDYGYHDTQGYLFVLGRADDVIQKGERIGTMEVESVVVTHPSVAEACAVGYPKVDGEGILLIVVPRKGVTANETLAEDLKSYLRNPGFLVDRVVFASRLPKTKSGKIMRRLIRALIRGENPGDISTLDDVTVLHELREVLKLN